MAKELSPGALIFGRGRQRLFRDQSQRFKVLRLRPEGRRYLQQPRLAVTSIAGHFCIDAFKAVSPVPVIDLLEVVQREVRERGLTKVGLLGTRMFIESRFDGVLHGVDVIAPADTAAVHEACVAMASPGVAMASHREVFLRAGLALARSSGCGSVLLAGTDLALMFGQESHPSFDIFDCAKAHAMAIADAALSDPGPD